MQLQAVIFKIPKSKTWELETGPMSTSVALQSENDDVKEASIRTERYDSFIDQLRKDLPKYLTSNGDILKTSKPLSKGFRVAASTETDTQLKSTFLACANRLEALDDVRTLFISTEKTATSVLSDTKQLIIQPMKEVIHDTIANRKKKIAATTQYNIHMQSLAENPRLLNEKQQAQNVALAADKIAATAAVNIADKNLPIHSKLFEAHRVRNMKKLLLEVFHNELLFHCRAVEELSQILNAVNEINDEDTQVSE